MGLGSPIFKSGGPGAFHGEEQRAPGLLPGHFEPLCAGSFPIAGPQNCRGRHPGRDLCKLPPCVLIRGANAGTASLRASAQLFLSGVCRGPILFSLKIGNSMIGPPICILKLRNRFLNTGQTAQILFSSISTRSIFLGSKLLLIISDYYLPPRGSKGDFGVLK